MEQVLADAIRSNNEGALHLKRGDLSAASSSFTAALELSREIALPEMMASSTTTVSDVCPPSHHHQVLSLDACMYQESSQESFYPSLDNEVTQDRPEDQYVYRHPITIPPNILSTFQSCRHDFGTPPHHEWSLFLGCITTFNVSLTLHLTARERQPSLLPAVARLYKMCLELLQRRNRESCDLRYTLATLNNLGVVHQELDQEHSAQVCFGHVWSTLCLNSPPFDGVDAAWEGFLRNVTNLLSQSAGKSLAPAA